MCAHGFPALLGIRRIQSLCGPDSDRTPGTLVEEEEMRVGRMPGLDPRFSLG